jgi:hypothetical protein
VLGQVGRDDDIIPIHIHVLVEDVRIDYSKTGYKETPYGKCQYWKA